MKRILTILATVILAITAAAQQPMATLSHNGQLSFFEGDLALEYAIDAAVNNDIIYLSEGDFGRKNNVILIKHRIAIIGSGYNSNIFSTIVYDNVDLGDVNILDGLFAFDIDFTGKEGTYGCPTSSGNTVISKSYICHLELGDSMKNLFIDRCYIMDYDRTLRDDIDYSNYNIQIKNSKIERLEASKNGNIALELLENCNIWEIYCHPLMIKNSIVEYASDQYGIQFNTNWENSILGKIDYIDPDHLKYIWYLDQDNIFSNELECIMDLTEYLDTNGTPIGIYGGEWLPYSVYPSVPTIDSANSSVMYDKDNNQLNVDIMFNPLE